MNHLVLNDSQKEDEDFILRQAGRPGAITIATNAAGRGTDIIIAPAAIQSGGLHVVIAFFPANLRVECQALGRAGRQGQSGTCEIMFACDELFARHLGLSAGEDLASVYAKRTEQIKIESERRQIRTRRERYLFGALSKFFRYLDALCEQTRKAERETGESSLLRVKLDDIKQRWADFFTGLCETEADILEPVERWSDTVIRLFVSSLSA
jgi:preprotein translocase subunit SecA